MEPVVGVDVAKGSSVVQAFRKRNEPVGTAIVIAHGASGFEQFTEMLGALQVETGVATVVVLEATGHYHRALVSCLNRSGYTHYIVNPLQSKRAKGAQLRKVKTDAADAWHLAEMYYRGDVKPHRTWDETFTELQHLTRQHEFVTGIFVQAKLNSRALLVQVFPGYEQVFYNVFSTTSLTVLSHCLEGSVANWNEVIQENSGRSHSKRWAYEKARKLEEILGEWGETRRSSKRLRRSLYLAVQCGMRKNVNARIRSYYEKKRKEGKPYKVAVIACANKLLHHIFAILQKGQPYQA